jgi:phosphopantothenoylcysteine decarboxylase/phosphopantothenate--cysteine ligase
LVKVESAKEMHEAVMDNKDKQYAIIMAAAVADYRPAVAFWQKMKKTDGPIELALSRTIDILAALGAVKNGSRLIGFAVETNDHVANAKEKLNSKNLDMIIVNDVTAFESDSSELKLIDRSGKIEALPELTKQESAHRILDAILRL